MQTIDGLLKPRHSIYSTAFLHSIPLAVLWLAIPIITAIRKQFESSWVMTAISLLGAFILIFICLIAYRKRLDPLAEYKYSQAVKLGFFQSLFAALIASILCYIAFKLFFTDYIAAMREYAAQSVYERTGSAEQAEMAVKVTMRIASSGFITLTMFISDVLYGLLISLIAAVFVRRKATEEA